MFKIVRKFSVLYIALLTLLPLRLPKIFYIQGVSKRSLVLCISPHFDVAADLLFWATYSPKQFLEEVYCCRVLILKLDSAAVEWVIQRSPPQELE